MKEEIKQAIAQNLRVGIVNKVRNDVAFGWTQVVAAVQGADDADKATIVRLMLGTPLLQKRLEALADAEADAMLADDSLSLAELRKVLTRTG
jgi:hypothetical protein